MNSISELQETAYDKVLKWSKCIVKAMGRDAPEITWSMRRAVDALKQKPTLLQ